ncbi:hypothetical protein [Streptomyces griseofuscus]|uniref:hypothetical protein n=1 Tax=Streptomyces griseofuscus TaxID=146922 RepID=UPI0033F17FD5
MSTVEEVRGITRGGGAAFTALWSGSMVLCGKLCGCGTSALKWAWDQASVDTEATAAKQAKADKKAQAKARPVKKAAADEDQDDETEDEPEVSAPPVVPVRRPVAESLGMLVLGGVLAAGAVGTVGTLVWPYVQELAPWRGVIATVGGLAWMVAAWMVAPSPAPAEDDAEQLPDDAAAVTQEGTAADALARHILERLAELAEQGRSGLHVTSLIDSAQEDGLLAPGAMDKAAMRAWLDASGFPVTKSVKVKGDVDYGLRVDRVSEALGMPPEQALAHLSGEGSSTPAQTAPQAPAGTPSSAPESAPAPAAPEPRLTLVKPLPAAAVQGSAQEVA